MDACFHNISESFVNISFKSHNIAVLIIYISDSGHKTFFHTQLS